MALAAFVDYTPVLITMLSASLCAMMGISIITYTYTCEAFPTKVRGSAVSVCAVCGRFASILGPSLSLFLYQINPKIPIVLYALFGLLNMINMFFSRPDRRGQNLEGGDASIESILLDASERNKGGKPSPIVPEE
jgi:MFS family permease